MSNIKKYFTSPYLWGFLIGIASLHLIKEMAMRNRSAPPPILQVADWQLLDQNARPFGQKDLLGKVVIANFFFTSCPSVCPKLTEAMKEVYQRLEKQSKQIEFIGISIDPETDTSQVLNAFMTKNGLNKPNWHCLTGTKQEIYQVVVDKMKIHVGEKELIRAPIINTNHQASGHDQASEHDHQLESEPALYDIQHIAQLALFDQNGALRGLFKTDSIELSALVRAAKFLLEKGS